MTRMHGTTLNTRTNMGLRHDQKIRCDRSPISLTSRIATIIAYMQAGSSLSIMEFSKFYCMARMKQKLVSRKNVKLTPLMNDLVNDHAARKFACLGKWAGTMNFL